MMKMKQKHQLKR